jgi:hypothetical protein
MPLLYDDWELDEELRHVGRVLAPQSEGTEGDGAARVDEPHAELPPPHFPGPVEPDPKPAVEATEPSQSQGVLPLLTWLATLLGTMAIVCGGVLVGWAWLTERAELWRIGQPIALGGVCALVVGLVLQLDRAWQERPASDPPVADQTVGEPAQTTANR